MPILHLESDPELMQKGRLHITTHNMQVLSPHSPSNTHSYCWDSTDILFLFPPQPSPVPPPSSQRADNRPTHKLHMHLQNLGPDNSKLIWSENMTTWCLIKIAACATICACCTCAGTLYGTLYIILYRMSNRATHGQLVIGQSKLNKKGVLHSLFSIGHQQK